MIARLQDSVACLPNGLIRLILYSNTS